MAVKRNKVAEKGRSGVRRRGSKNYKPLSLPVCVCQSVCLSLLLSLSLSLPVSPTPWRGAQSLPSPLPELTPWTTLPPPPNIHPTTFILACHSPHPHETNYDADTKASLPPATGMEWNGHSHWSERDYKEAKHVRVGEGKEGKKAGSSGMNCPHREWC